VDILDEENKFSDEESTVLPPSFKSVPKIHLGSEKVEKGVEKGAEKKKKTIGSFAAELPQGPSCGFQGMLEEFLNSYEEHQLPHSDHLQVSDSQQVISILFSCGVLLMGV
jgi:hypothetical protein